MGWIQPDTNTDLSNFNLTAEQEKIKRKRKLAQLIGLDGSTQLPQGIMTPGGPGNVGIYTKPSTGATLAALLQKGLGAYNEAQLNKAEDGLGKLSQEAFASQLNKLNDKVRDPNQNAFEANAELTREARRKPSDGSDVATTDWIQAEQAQPTDDTMVMPVEDRQRNLVVSQLDPVKQIATTRSLPERKAKPELAAKAIAAQSAPADEPAPRQKGFYEDANKELHDTFFPPNTTPQAQLAGRVLRRGGTPTELRAPMISGGSGQSSAAFAAQDPRRLDLPQASAASPTPAQIPADLASQGQPPAPPGTQFFPPQPVPPQTAPQPAPTPFTLPPEQGGGSADPYSRAPTQQELIARLGALSNTGQLGNAVGSRLMDNMVGGKGNEWETIPSKDPTTGDITGAIQVNKHTGETRQLTVPGMRDAGRRGKPIGQVDTPSGLYNRFADGSQAPALDQNGQHLMGVEAQKTKDKRDAESVSLNQTLSAGDELKTRLRQLTSPDPQTGKAPIDAAAGFTGKLAGALSHIGVSTDASRTSADIDSLKSQMWMYGIARLKQAGGGVSSANSDAEGARLENALASLDISRLGTEGFIRAANNIMSQIDQSAAMVEAQARQQGTTVQTSGGRRQPGTRSGQLSYGMFQ